MSDEREQPTANPTRVSRRGLFRGLAAGGVAVGGGAVGALAFGGGSSLKKQPFSIDVACLGASMRTGKLENPADDADFRAPFMVEGWIYPAGFIKGDGFNPTEEGSTGRWFCRGWLLTDSTRAEPHGSTQQDFYFGRISKDRNFPPDMLSAVGLEGTEDKKQVATRAIIGGTGKYLGATGQVRQTWTYWNTSPLPGADGAFCFRYDFDARVLD